MALPPKVKTWQYDVNQLFSGSAATDTGRNIILAIKNSMKNFVLNPWVVWGSSATGNFVGNNDGVDRWTDTTAIGTGNRWIVLENLVTSMQVCFYMYNNTQTNYVRIIVSPNGEFGAIGSGGTGTDGVAASPPTAGDQHQVYSAAFVHSSVYTGKLHVMHSSDGECTRILTTVANVCQLFWLFDMPSSPTTGFTTGIWGARAGDANATQYAWWNDTATIYGEVSGDLIGMYVTCEGALTSMVGEYLISQDDDTGEWPIMPMGLLNTVGTHRGRKGSIYDLWWGSTAVAVGTAFPADLSYQFVQFGHIIFPWNGTAPETA